MFEITKFAETFYLVSTQNPMPGQFFPVWVLQVSVSRIRWRTPTQLLSRPVLLSRVIKDKDIRRALDISTAIRFEITSVALKV